MKKVVNIYNSGELTDFKQGKYKIDILGGWGVSLRGFSILLKNTQTDKLVKCKKAFWPLQSYAFKKKSRRIFTLEISESGTYAIEFENPDDIQLKKTNLFFCSGFQDTIPNSDISVYIRE